MAPKKIKPPKPIWPPPPGATPRKNKKQLELEAAAALAADAASVDDFEPEPPGANGTDPDVPGANGTGPNVSGANDSHPTEKASAKRKAGEAIDQEEDTADNVSAILASIPTEHLRTFKRAITAAMKL